MLAQAVQGARGRQRGTKLSKPTIVLFGDSHSYAVQRAIEKRQGSGLEAPLTAYRLAKIKNGKQQGDTTFEKFLDIVRLLNADDVVLSMIGGNQHAVFGTIQHPKPFDFLEPGKSSKPEVDAEIIPYRTLSTVFEKGIRNGDGKSLEALRKATSARVVHVLPPPPKKDNLFIQRYHESHFAKEGIVAQGVSTPQLRLKFWSMQTRLLQKICGELGIEIFPPPAAAVDSAGFLASDYYANDATHANYAYGELLIREVETRYRPETEGSKA